METQLSAAWWKRAVIYEIYVRSFMDSNGDGVGDLNGITLKLDYLHSLGVDAIWLTPFYPSPQVDFGYDVSDYENVDPQFGTLEDFDRLVTEARKRNIRIITDLVLNHTSNKHPYFLESQSSRTSGKRDWYIWHDGKDGGPPNNWSSCFGPSAWTYDRQTGQYYYHFFYSEQPDLNWRNPEVEQALFEMVKFWLNRGVDGFRLDAINCLFEDPHLLDNPLLQTLRAGSETEYEQEIKYNRDLPDVHIAMKRLRAFVERCKPGCLLIGEAYVPTINHLIAYYGDRDNELQLPFNFFFTKAEALSAPIFRKIVADAEEALDGRPTTYVLNNHDLPRIDRYTDETHLNAVAKLSAMMLFTLRGTPFLYYGEEIGMATTDPETIDEVWDPVGRQYWPVYKGRDGARTPMQWDARTNAGFSSSAPWLKIPPSSVWRNVAVQENDPGSVLNFYKRAIRLRRRNVALLDGAYEAIGDDPYVFAYRRFTEDQSVIVAINMSGQSRQFHFPNEILSKSVNARIQLSGFNREGERISLECLNLAPYEALAAEISPPPTK